MYFDCICVATLPGGGTDNSSKSLFSVINYTAALLIPYSKHNTTSVYLSLSLFPYASPLIPLSPSFLCCLRASPFAPFALLTLSSACLPLTVSLFLSASCCPSLLLSLSTSFSHSFFFFQPKYTDDSLWISVHLVFHTFHPSSRWMLNHIFRSFSSLAE